MRSIIASLLILIASLCFAQDIKYARSVVDTLAAPGMHGRGYVNDGDKIAAAFIENEFKKFGLNFFGESYRQGFTLSVNTFPGEVFFGAKADNSYLPGEQYIVDAASPSASFEDQSVLFVDSVSVKDLLLSKKWKKKAKGKFVLIDPAGIRKEDMQKFNSSVGAYDIKGLIVVKDKLTWSVSQQVDKFPIIEVSRGTLLGQLKASKQVNELKIGNKLIPSYKTQNLIGYIPGSQYPDSFIVFSAHYDHLGRMGKDTYFPGANDNASGIAMMLNLAKYYSENKPKYSIAFMAFGAEEAGLVGSKYYVEHPLFPLKQIKFLINTDLAGTGDDGITVVNGTIYNTEYKRLVKLNAQGSYLKEVKPRGKAANSDHYFFTEAGVKAFFIYTMGGIKAYHDVFDRAETLPLTEFEDYFRLINDFIRSLEQQ